MSLSFHGLKTIQICLFFFKIDLNWAFDRVCYKLLYDFPSLDCRNVTFNMFAIMFFCLIINFNVMFSVFGIYFIVSVLFIFIKDKSLLFSFFYRFICWPKFHIYLCFVCQFLDRYQQLSLAIIGSILFYWSSYQSIGNYFFFLRTFWRKGE